jgi:choline-sulfatase
MRRKLILASFILPALVVLVASGCGGDDDAPAVRVPDGTPVVVISVDTLRSDRLPMYGYGGVETPALDALRADSILFEHAYAHVPLTLPSHLSMFTGKLPPGHGVRDNLGYEIDTAAHPWLPRILQESGYATGGAVSAFVLRRSTGMGDGFDFYEDRVVQRNFLLGDAQRTGDRTLDAAREWLESVHEEPFFFFFHIYEPHLPLSAPEPFASRFDDPYDAEVASADAIVGDLLDRLRELGVYDRSVILFVSDHGEGLGDHGLVEHGPLLYREQIQVPLLLKLPGGEDGGSTVARSAQLADVAPTVLDLLGLPRPDDMDGEALTRVARAADGGEPRTIFSETFFPRTQFGWSELSSAIRYPYHLIHGPAPELYDLENDPGETENVIREERRQYAALRDALEGYDGAYAPPTRSEDPEVRQRLAALGYIGSSGDTGEESLADPKSKLHVLEDLGEAVQLAQANRFEAAAAKYREVLAEEPNLTTAWEYLGNSLLRLGRTEEALAAYEEQMRASGGAANAALNVAGALFRLGRLEEAEEHAELAVEDYPRANDLLAQIALRQGDLEAAARYVERSLADDNGQPGPRITRAELLVKQGRPEEALAQVDEIEAMIEREGIDRDIVRGIYVVRGDALAQLGRAAEAERAFQREIEMFPGELAPYTRLALLYALSGRPEATGAVLQRMVQVHPTPAAYAEAVRALRVMGDERSAERLLSVARERWPDSPVLARAAAG